MTFNLDDTPEGVYPNVPTKDLLEWCIEMKADLDAVLTEIERREIRVYTPFPLPRPSWLFTLP